MIRTARVTGLLYLGLALGGGVGFLLVRPRLFDPADPSATLANLVADPALARAGIVFELFAVLTQALAAVWFARLFRRPAAWAIAAFGLANAFALMVSAALSATALSVAERPYGDPAALVQTLYLAGDHLWGVGSVFFGLWLIPMGWCVLRSGLMPRPLGSILIGGGVGYVLSAFSQYALPDAGLVAELLVLPATVGEFWIIGYLLIVGVRRGVAPAGPDIPEVSPALPA
ncbi:DUF4386 domain-containing protein [Paractinoplanes brasiliensis]|uniref:Uncharacterized protein DUF4386 n=1 Tax=Paractinoplanes brasiliensis TaxID=52695 RepID=A0A4R6J9K3_9ACTN|nr:DUF4386 domain-containing protein [Actinoplanes brasiliensis]TDO32162.1 uncharacterized protein DUF4386 [Actinoplanes brasiliensis]GID28216.1 hypothetical protein Abr02nite_31990 [Actinoplanes brasiliensis]